MNLHSKQWCSIACALPLGLASVSACAEATALPWEVNTNDYQGFYVYGQIGQASANTSRSEVEDGLQAIDSSIENVWVEEADMAWSAGLGYFVKNWLSVELGWTDLGDRSVRLDESSTFPASGSDYYPQSGEGASLGLIGHIPLIADFYLAPKIGLFAWKDDAPKNNDGVDFWYGAEINYRLSEDVSIFAGWQQFELPRQDVDFYSIGLRYRFGQQAPEAIVAPVAPIFVAPAPVVAQVLDSDADGVIDTLDQCPGTPQIYQVDGQGCTLFKEEYIEYRLVINYANNSAVIVTQYDDKMQALFQFARDNDIEKIHVEGHTSAVGSERFNQALSLRRAQSVINVLSAQYGLDPNVFIAEGKGESELLEGAPNEDVNALNRRTEIVAEKTIKKEVMR